MLYRISEIRKSLFIDAQVCSPRTCAFLLLPAMKIILIIKNKKGKSDVSPCCFGYKMEAEGKEKQKAALIRRTLFFLSRRSGWHEGLLGGWWWGVCVKNKNKKKLTKKKPAVMEQTLRARRRRCGSKQFPVSCERASECLVPAWRPENAGRPAAFPTALQGRVARHWLRKQWHTKAVDSS